LRLNLFFLFGLCFLIRLNAIFLGSTASRRWRWFGYGFGLSFLLLFFSFFFIFTIVFHGNGKTICVIFLVLRKLNVVLATGDLHHICVLCFIIGLLKLIVFFVFANVKALEVVSEIAFFKASFIEELVKGISLSLRHTFAGVEFSSQFCRHVAKCNSSYSLTFLKCGNAADNLFQCHLFRSIWG